MITIPLHLIFVFTHLSPGSISFPLSLSRNSLLHSRNSFPLSSSTIFLYFFIAPADVPVLDGDRVANARDLIRPHQLREREKKGRERERRGEKEGGADLLISSQRSTINAGDIAKLRERGRERKERRVEGEGGDVLLSSPENDAGRGEQCWQCPV